MVRLRLHTQTSRTLFPFKGGDILTRLPGHTLSISLVHYSLLSLVRFSLIRILNDIRP